MEFRLYCDALDTNAAWINMFWIPFLIAFLVAFHVSPFQCKHHVPRSLCEKGTITVTVYHMPLKRFVFTRRKYIIPIQMLLIFRLNILFDSSIYNRFYSNVFQLFEKLTFVSY